MKSVAASVSRGRAISVCINCIPVGNLMISRGSVRAPPRHILQHEDSIKQKPGVFLVYGKLYSMEAIYSELNYTIVYRGKVNELFVGKIFLYDD